ncbi:hypothetical protein APHAL10511_005094 [Amanita phalloides]|nr:hypothetical protein APHAL10511_005094 [Amanita phalloides]
MPGRRFALFSLLLASLYSLSFAEEKACTIHGNGNYYNLSPLKNSRDYELRTSGGQLLVLNVCNGVHRDLIGFKEGEDPAGFIRRGHGDFSIGKVNQTLSLTGSGPRLVLADGSLCKTSSDEPIDKIRASTVIDFICDMTVFSTGAPRLVAQMPPNDENAACAFYFEWRTHHACPTSESAAWGFFTTLAMLILVIVMGYTILGTLYNRYVLHLRGYDQIPQFSMESMKYHVVEAFDWLKDMITILYANSHIGGENDGGLPLRRPGGSADGLNPLSHFTQSREGNEFVRPQPTRNEAVRRHDINPVSHQSQVQADFHSTKSSSQQFQPPLSSVPRQEAARECDTDVRQNVAPAGKEEFILDDEEEQGQEMGAMSSTSPASARHNINGP